MEHDNLLPKDEEFHQINQIYDECLSYLKDTSFEDGNKVTCDDAYESRQSDDEPDYDTIDENGSITINDDNSNKEESIIDEHKEVIEPKNEAIDELIEAKNDEIDDLIEAKNEEVEMKPKIAFKVVNEMKSTESIISECKSERLRKLSQQLPKIVITQSTNSLEMRNDRNEKISAPRVPKKKVIRPVYLDKNLQHRNRVAYGAYPKRLVSKSGIENVALISNVPYEKIRLLNDTFHTLINLRWRWIVTGTIVVHFAIWLVFAVFWYITALAHYDLEPDPPKRTCVTGGKDFVTIFLASVEAQTTIGFGDRAIDEECPESVFLLVMQLILGTGLSGVLTCVVYAKLTRPEKLSRDGVGFSKKAVISMRDGKLCLMMRAWDLNYDHIISSEFTAHFIHTYKTKEGEVIRYYAQTLPLQHKQFLLWPITLVHVIDRASPLYGYTPQDIAHNSYEITVSLKGASASMGTFTQSQTSYLPREVLWGHRFPTVVKYNQHKQKYAIEHHKLDSTEPVDTPYCSAKEIYNNTPDKPDVYVCPGTPGSFSDKVSEFHLERTSSFKQNYTKA